VRPVAGGSVLEADAGDGVSDVLVREGRHESGLLDSAHGGGHVSGQDALHHDSLARVLYPQVFGKFVDKCLKKGTLFKFLPNNI